MDSPKNLGLGKISCRISFLLFFNIRKIAFGKILFIFLIAFNQKNNQCDSQNAKGKHDCPVHEGGFL